MVKHIDNWLQVPLCTRSQIPLRELSGFRGIGFRIPLRGLSGFWDPPGLVVTEIGSVDSYLETRSNTVS